MPGEVGLWDPVTQASNLTQISSIPLDMQTTDANVGADWKLGGHNTLGATYAYSRYEPSNRERSEVDDNSIKLTWVNRALDWLTFRANYTFLKQSGDRYNYDPYAFAFSSSLPGYVDAAGRRAAVHGRCAAQVRRLEPRREQGRPDGDVRRARRHDVHGVGARRLERLRRRARPAGLRHDRRRAAVGMAALAFDERERLLRLRSVEARHGQRQRRRVRQRSDARRRDLPARRPLVGDGQAEEPQRRRDADAAVRTRAFRCELELHLLARHDELHVRNAGRARVFRGRIPARQRVPADELSASTGSRSVSRSR